MTSYYVDSSVLVAILFEEQQAKKFRGLLKKSRSAFSSFLLEAEVYSAAAREKVELKIAEDFIRSVSLVFPERSFQKEYAEIFSSGYCRGADAHHIACALFLDPKKEELIFLTADNRQKASAKNAGLICWE